MGFNLTAFLGGAARGGSQVLDERRAEAERARVTKEERQWQLAAESRAEARAKKARRASDKKALEEQIGTMVALGMDPEAARAVAKNGKGAMKVAIGDLEYGRENGINAASYYTMGQKGLLQGDASANIKSAEPAGLSIDSEGIRNMYGAVDEDYSSHNEQIRAITNKQLNLSVDSNEYKQLETQRQALYTDIGAIAKAKDTSGEDDGRKFTEGTVRATIGGELNKQLQYRGMSYNLETQVIVGLEGDVVGANIAALNAAATVRQATKSVNDQFMKDSIDALQTNAIKEIKQYGYGVIKDAPEKIKQLNSVTQDTDRELKIGDLIKVPATNNQGEPLPGLFTYSIYTGTKDNNHYLKLYTGK